jgi:hypothetical protein
VEVLTVVNELRAAFVRVGGVTGARGSICTIRIGCKVILERIQEGPREVRESYLSRPFG